MNREVTTKNYNFLLVILIVIFDQIIKFAVIKLGIVSVCNQNFAFGIESGIFSLAVPIATSLFIGYMLYKEGFAGGRGRKLLLFGYAMILAGGISNIFDRIIRGCVVDFVDLKIWPLFNLADAAISVGVVIVIYSFLFKREEKSKA